MNETKAQLKQKIAEHLAQQPESIQAQHRWMGRLEAAGLGLIAAVFIAALYISIRWETMPKLLIPFAWFCFAGSPSILIVFVGLHSILVKASPLGVMPGFSRKFVAGREAVGRGWGTIILGLFVGAFWGYIAYTMLSFTWEKLTPLITILGAFMGVMIVVSMLLTMYQKLVKAR